MKRPVLAIGLSWFFATWLAFFCGKAVFRISFAALLTSLLFFLLRKRFRYAYAACIVMLSAALALASFWIYERRRVEPFLALAGKSAEVEGLITEAELGIKAMTYTIKADFTEYSGLPSTTLIIRDFTGIERSVGDTVRFRTALTAAPSTSWYKSRGILLLGQSPDSTQSIPAGKYRLERALIRLRAIFSRNAYANLSEENANVVTAMVLGLANNLTPEVYSALGKSGTSHLLSVSGLHLSILSAVVLAALKRLRCPRVLDAAVALIFSFLFSMLVGFGASIFRSFVMTSITLLAGRVFSRRSDSLSSLGLALFVCAVAWPHWTLGWGIWLSAGSTFGIILYGSRLSHLLYKSFGKKPYLPKRLSAPIASALGTSVAAYAFTLPVLLLMSGWISIISPLANLLIAPFVPVAILGGAVCAVVPAGAPAIGIVAAATDISISFIVKISEILGSLPFATFAIDESWILILLLGICAMAAALIYFRASKRLTAYAAALIAVCCCVGDLSLAYANGGRVELVTLEGKNCSVLLRGSEAVILGTPDAYEISGLLRYLAFRGVKNIPAVIATDSPDNAGSGLLRLSGAYDIDCVIAPNDVYIEQSLARATPESMVYSGGYAEITALGKVKIRPGLTGGDIYVQIGKNEIVKIRRECDIIEADGRIRIFDDGKMLLPSNIYPLYEPAGAFLFGESRVSVR